MYLHQLQKVIQKQKEAIRNASPELRAKWAAESEEIARKVSPPTKEELVIEKIRAAKHAYVPPELR